MLFVSVLPSCLPLVLPSTVLSVSRLFFQVNSVFNNPALPPRNWFSADSTLVRLQESLEVLASDHLNSVSRAGTYHRQGGRCAVPNRFELFLDAIVHHFTLSISKLSNDLMSHYSTRTHVSERWSVRDVSQPEAEVRILDRLSRNDTHATEEAYAYNLGPPAPHGSAQTWRGDYCLLHSDRVAVPCTGEAATASLEEILGAEHDFLQPSTLLKPEVLRNSQPFPVSEGLTLPLSLTKSVRARAHAHPGEWQKVVLKMKAAGMCDFDEVGSVYENSVFGVLKKADVHGVHRLIFACDVANHIFSAGCGAVELPNPDVLSQLQLEKGQKLYLASTDISQCYNRLRVPQWMRRFLGMPRVLSSELGVLGPRRLLVPVLTVLPMGIIPAVRLCQAVTVTLSRRASPARTLSRLGPFEISRDVLPLDIIYLDDLTVLGTDSAAVNARRVALVKIFAENGLPEEASKAVVAREGHDGEALGLLFRQSGILSVTPTFFYKLLHTTKELLSTRQCSPRHLAEVVGCWVYACLPKRPMLSVLSAVYPFEQESGYERLRPLPDAVLRELSILLDLAPAMCCDLSASVSGRVYATDASESGSGVTYLDNVTPVEPELLSESRVRKNWQSSLQAEAGDDLFHSLPNGSLKVSREFTNFFEQR